MDTASPILTQEQMQAALALGRRERSRAVRRLWAAGIQVARSIGSKAPGQLRKAVAC